MHNMEITVPGAQEDGALLPTPTSASSSKSIPVTPTGNHEDKKDSIPSDIDFAVKHPLHHSWVLWYDNPGSKRPSQKDWMSNLKPVATIVCIEDFWGTINNIRRPSKLSAGSNFHLFKTGIKPMWEDPLNKNGGRWIYGLPKKQVLVDDQWLSLMLAMIGEQFEPAKEICGAVVSIRKSQERVALWTRTATDKDTCLNIGNTMKIVLEVPAGQKLDYNSHQETKQGENSIPRYRYEL